MIKVVRGEHKPEPLTSFPKLMISKRGKIILAEKCCGDDVHGVLLFGNSEFCLAGEHGTLWSISCFADYDGELILSNKKEDCDE